MAYRLSGRMPARTIVVRRVFERSRRSGRWRNGVAGCDEH